MEQGVDSEAVMHIGEVAARTELSLRSLRHWEEVGLLEPSGRTEGGFRLYTEDDVEKIMVIRRMKPLGFSLNQMKQVMRDLQQLDDSTTGGGEASSARERIHAVREDATERRGALVRQVKMADEFIALIEERIG